MRTGVMGAVPERTAERTSSAACNARAMAVKIDDASRAFQRVEGTERAIEPLLVVGPGFQCEQVVVALGHELSTLDQELFDELVHAGIPHMMEACSTSAAWLTGLTR